MKLSATTAVVGALVLGACLSLASPALAVLEGRNGRIAFTSGREGVNDNLSQLYMRGASGSTGVGSLSPPFAIAGTQNRHPSWSPDRTKVVFAAGTPGAPTTEEFDLFVRDFVANTITPLDLLEIGDGLSSDHPAWSPDGTRIAYEQQPVDNSANRDIKVKAVGTARRAESLTNSPQTEFKPAWTPDSQTLYYAKTSAGPPVNHDIVKQPAAGGPETPVANQQIGDEYQPSISPDGKRICFTWQSKAGDPATAEIYTATLPDLTDGVNLSADPSRGDINCTWSPDGKRIAYVNGVFSQGKLVMKNADNSSPGPVLLEDDLGSNNFDGNPDWAPDGSPECPDSAITTPANTPVTIALECTDTGPEYERTDPNGTIPAGGEPRNGTISDDAPTANPSTVRYTPKPGFTGTDTIVYTSFDSFGFGTDTGTVTITVTAPGGGGIGGGAGGAGGGAGQDRTAPVLGPVTLTRKRFAVARAATAVTAARRGTKIGYRLSEPARVTLRIQRIGTRRPTGTLRRTGRAGANRVAFSGRIGRRALRPGRYRLTVHATDAAGNRSTARAARFRIVR